MKVCPVCRKANAVFYRRRASRDGLERQCKECQRAYMSAYRAAHPEKVKARNAVYGATYRAAHPEKLRPRHLMNRYGLTEDQYQTLLLIQNGCCAICYFQMAKPCIDHDHATGEVRGLLCHRCNIRLDHPQRRTPLFDAELFYLKATQSFDGHLVLPTWLGHA